MGKIGKLKRIKLIEQKKGKRNGIKKEKLHRLVLAWRRALNFVLSYLKETVKRRKGSPCPFPFFSF